MLILLNFQYKFNVDGVWMHHPREPTVNDGVGGFNNIIRVTEADAEVFRYFTTLHTSTEFGKNNFQLIYPTLYFSLKTPHTGF